MIKRDDIKEGMRVRLNNGKRQGSISTCNKWGEAYVKWDGGKGSWHSHDALTTVTDEEDTKGNTNMSVMYEIEDPLTGETLIGSKLTEKSSDTWVVEVQGRAHPVFIVSADKCKEIVPYTIRLGNGQNHEVAEGVFKVGDVIILKDGTLTAVSALDTKARRNNGKLVGARRVVTEAIH